MKPHPYGVLAGASGAAYARSAWQLVDSLHVAWKAERSSLDAVLSLARAETAVLDSLLELVRGFTHGLGRGDQAFLAAYSDALTALREMTDALVRSVTHAGPGSDLAFDRCRTTARQSIDRLLGRT